MQNEVQLECGSKLKEFAMGLSAASEEVVWLVLQSMFYWMNELEMSSS